MISNWYRNARLKAKAKAGETTGKFLESGREAPALPRRLGLTQYYISRHWDTRILKTFEAIRERNLAQWKALIAGGNSDGKKKPSAIISMNEAVAKQWSEETEEFKANLLEQQNKERQAAEEGLQQLMSPTDEERSPEEYQAYVLFALFHLPPTCANGLPEPSTMRQLCFNRSSTRYTRRWAWYRRLSLLGQCLTRVVQSKFVRKCFSSFRSTCVI